MNQNEFLQLQEIVNAAGRLTMDFYGRTQAVEKPDRTLVTAADQAVEDFLRPRLLELLPGSGFIGEEEAAAAGNGTVADWTWVVDPLDGTAAFIEGIDNFCVSAGLFHQQQPYAGVVYFPALNHVYSAMPGSGAWYDGRAINVLVQEPLQDLQVLYVDAKAHLEYSISFPGKTRSMGSAALHYLLVARGAACGALCSAYVWDYAAAAAVLQQAGGVLRHLDGSQINWNNWLGGRKIQPPILGAPPSLWDKLAAQIKEI